jgi:MoxR-like ATPase
MKPSKLYEALHALIGERVPLHIWGACGVGKSQIVAQVARDLDVDFLDVRAVQLDPVDLRGLLHPDKLQRNLKVGAFNLHLRDDMFR